MLWSCLSCIVVQGTEGESLEWRVCDSHHQTGLGSIWVSLFNRCEGASGKSKNRMEGQGMDSRKSLLTFSTSCMSVHQVPCSAFPRVFSEFMTIFFYPHRMDVESEAQRSTTNEAKSHNHEVTEYLYKTRPI